MDIKKVFLEKFCHQMMNLDGSNKHYVIDPIVIDSPQFITDWIEQQVKVKPEVIVKLAEFVNKELKEIDDEYEEEMKRDPDYVNEWLNGKNDILNEIKAKFTGKALSNKIHDIIVSRVEPPVKPACEIRRPQFRDYLPADMTTQTITDMFLANKELYRYIVSLDGYIDELESKSE